MKTCHNLFVGVGFFILCCTMFTACVNHISEEEGEIINNGDIPLKFVADIHEIMNTRVVNNSFGEKDEVGLFALAGTTTMQEERYADNLHFVRSSTGEFVSDESVYYPDDGVTLNLISYYPYQNSGVAMGESSMQVTVATTQDKLDDYSHSDFLVASKKEVLASKDAVALTYNHQFFRMKIVLVPGEGENIEEILSEISQEVERYVTFGVSDKNLKRVVKAVKNKNLFGNESLENICSVFADCFTKGIEVLDIYAKYDIIKNNDIREELKTFSRNNRVLSVVGG